ncbi:hypothetical protein KBC03_06180 [Patescibacteria group bacterium]|nr:hypothetical protein [Patescibacteria group bacterium]
MAAKEINVKLGNEPHNNTGWQVFAKAAIGLAVGVVIAFLIFIILFLASSMFTQALKSGINSPGVANTVNPLLPLVLVIIAFIATFVGSVILSGLFNLFYSNKYYDLGKTFSVSLLTNIFLFFLMIPLYMIFYENINTLFYVLGFHIIFAIFISYCQGEFVTNPNYSSSHLLGAVIGAVLAVLGFAIVGKTFQGNQNMLLIPSILGYTLIPFFHALREKIYYKFYENGNNFLFLPSLSEIIAAEENVTTNDDITVDSN